VPANRNRHHVQMSKIRIDEADHLTVADVLHAKLSALDATATVADVRAYFAASASRRQAFLVQDGRYVGSITLALVQDEADPARLATEIADQGETLGLDAPATVGRDLALQTDARRVPVVDGDGTLVGVIAVTGDLTSFCGTNAEAVAIAYRERQTAASRS
jgi:CBS domain-containing protein